MTKYYAPAREEKMKAAGAVDLDASVVQATILIGVRTRTTDLEIGGGAASQEGTEV